MSSKARSTNRFPGFQAELAGDWSIDANLVCLSAVDSTNGLARGVAASARRTEALPRTAFVAWSQSAGRGRDGRRWESPPGDGVYCSLLWPMSGAQVLAALPVVVPAVLCDELGHLGVAGCGLKWPNDLLVGGRKLAGVLIESVSRGAAPSTAVIGFGVNYRTPAAAALERAVGLEELASPLPSLAAVARRLVGRLVGELDRLGEVGVDGWVATYRGLSVHRPGDSLVCRTGSERLEGHFAGFDSRGFLRLRLPAGERTIPSGDLVEIRHG